MPKRTPFKTPKLPRNLWPKTVTQFNGERVQYKDRKAWAKSARKRYVYWFNNPKEESANGFG